MGKYTHYNNISLMEVHKLAFTLAEALMTLAIIGIIAMLVIPTVVTSFKTKIWNSANETFTKKLDNAIQDMHTQNTLGGHQDTMSFVAELSKNFKINKICANDEIISCFEDTIYWDDEQVDMSKIKDAADLGQDDWETETVGVMFANGVTGVIAYNPDCDFDNNTDEASTASCIAILYDVDGFKKPNTLNKDIQAINIISIGEADDEYIEVACSPQFEWFPCPNSTVRAAIADVSADGMTALDAQAACEAIGMRLPKISEMTSLCNAYNRGEITGFVSADYWALGGEEASNGQVHNVNIPRCTSGWATGTSTSRHVRCVK